MFERGKSGAVEDFSMRLQSLDMGGDAVGADHQGKNRHAFRVFACDAGGVGDIDRLQHCGRRHFRPGVVDAILIGNLVMRALYDGLLTHCTGGDGDAITQLAWPTARLDADDQARTRASLVVPGLGLAKEYKNSWR